MTAALQDYVADDDASLREPRDAVMQRVRVGLTGLAAVFLLTLLAASILGMFGQDERGARLANGAVAANGAAAQAAEQPREPLAELGVAPGGSPSNVAATAPAPKPVAAASQTPPPRPAPRH